MWDILKACGILAGNPEGWRRFGVLAVDAVNVYKKVLDKYFTKIRIVSKCPSCGPRRELCDGPSCSAKFIREYTKPYAMFLS